MNDLTKSLLHLQLKFTSPIQKFEMLINVFLSAVDADISGSLIMNTQGYAKPNPLCLSILFPVNFQLQHLHRTP